MFYLRRRGASSRCAHFEKAAIKTPKMTNTARHMEENITVFCTRGSKQLTSAGGRNIIVNAPRGDVPLAQLDRASGYGPEGRGFESLMVRQRHRTRSVPFFFPPRDSYPRLTLGGACSASLAEKLRRQRYSVARSCSSRTLMVRQRHRTRSVPFFFPRGILTRS